MSATEESTTTLYKPTLEEVQSMYSYYDIDDIRTYRILNPGNDCGYVYVHYQHPVLDHLEEYGINGTPFHMIQHKIIDSHWYKLDWTLVQATALKIIRAEDMNAWHRVQRDLAYAPVAAGGNGAACGPVKQEVESI